MRLPEVGPCVPDVMEADAIATPRARSAVRISDLRLHIPYKRDPVEGAKAVKGGSGQRLHALASILQISRCRHIVTNRAQQGH